MSAERLSLTLSVFLHLNVMIIVTAVELFSFIHVLILISFVFWVIGFFLTCKLFYQMPVTYNNNNNNHGRSQKTRHHSPEWQSSCFHTSSLQLYAFTPIDTVTSSALNEGKWMTNSNINSWDAFVPVCIVTVSSQSSNLHREYEGAMLHPCF